MFQRSTEAHKYSTRSAETSISLESHNRSSIKFTLPKEWASLPEELKKCRSMKGFRDRSKGQIIEGYRMFECFQVNCWACGAGETGTSQRGQE